MRILLFFLLLPCYVLSQQPNLISATTATTIAYFEKGDFKKYQVKVTEEKITDGKDGGTETVSSSYDLLFKVIDVQDSSMIIDMTYLMSSQAPTSSKKKKHNKIELDELYAKLANITDHMTVRYKTNELGVFDTILNLKELGENLGEVFDVTINEFKQMIEGLDLKPEEREEGMKMINLVMTSMRDNFTKPENVEVLFLDDIISLHSAYGFELKLNKTEELEIYYNLFDNQTVMGKGKITLTNVNKPGDDFRFDVVQQPDPGEIEQFLLSFVRKMLPEEAQAEIDPKKYRYTASTKESYTMSLTTGWVRKLTIVGKSNVSYDGKNVKSNSKTEYILM